MDTEQEAQEPTRYFVYNGFYDLVYHDEHRGRYGFQFEHVEQDNVFYLFCEIDEQTLPKPVNAFHLKRWMEQHRDDLANLAEVKHAQKLSKKHPEQQMTGRHRYDVEISSEELLRLGLSS